jgi:hypothetical protein
MSENQSPQSFSLVAIDVGSVNTRAQFFDSVEGRYRFLAAGEAPSTVGAPAHDLNVGVIEALQHLQEITGRPLLAERGLLISPNNDDGVGANAVATTFSAGSPLKTVTVGLLEGVSLHSVNQLVNSGYCEIVESLSLNDRRGPDTVIDAICQRLPDLVVIAGGTDQGASRSVIRLTNYLALALKLIPEKQRPTLLFVGNQNLQEEIENLLGALTELRMSANIRPTLDLESPEPAKQQLAQIYFDIQARKVGGLQQLQGLGQQAVLPNANAFGRVIRFLSTVIDVPKGMLGIDLGASSTTVAAAFGGELQTRVYPGLGMGKGISGMIAETHLSQIARWIPMDLPDDTILDYLYNKPLFPRSLPSTPEELAIEQAAARQVMRLAIGKSLPLFPSGAIYPLPGTVPWFDRILVSGSAVTRAPRLEQSLLMILDALQPVGIATIILDQNNIAASVGAAANIDPLLAVQVLESNAFMNLGTVISPVGARSKGAPILRIQIMLDGQKQEVVEVREGGLQVVSLPQGKAVDLYVHPLQNVNVGLGPGRGGWVRRVVGGAFGLIIDARGRPVQVPTSYNRRQESLLTWQNALSGI